MFQKVNPYRDMKEVNREPVNNQSTEGFDRYEDVYYSHQPSYIIKFEHRNNQFIFQTENQFTLLVDVVDASILRFRYTMDSIEVDDWSYVLQPYPTFNQPVQFEEGLADFLISTPTLHCLISKSDLRIRILDRKNGDKVVHEDHAAYTVRRTILKGVERISIKKKAQPDESFFGLGDKSGHLNLRGQHLENWNTDSFGYEKDTDPLYRSIPFYYSLTNGKASGIFLHNTHRSFFDFDSTQENVITIAAAGGQMDYFFIHGPKLLDVAQRYTKLTGTPELPPLWALGFHQCRWSYFPEKRVKEIANGFRSRQIPCDAIYLDIDYMDGFRCFTWNHDYFPNPAQLIQELADMGIQTVVMIDPGIKVDPEYWVYQDGLNKNVFCRRTNGELMIGPVWPDSCVFPDFTNPEVREWWKQLYTDLYTKNGVSGFWNDMNEPAVFKVNRLTFPDEVLHDFEGNLATHAQAHNIYGLQMTRATLEGLKMLRPEKRPFLLARATFSGGQRYASIWTGDNIASWEHLRLANIQCQRISISGYSFTGTDIGGFAEVPDGELFVRWIQLGVFHPLFRVHSMGNHSGGAEMVDVEAVSISETENRLDQEPWSFGEPFTTYSREAIELRYQLLGYLYSAFQKYVTNGTPVIQSLVFYDQDDPKNINREQEFMCGSDLLISPVQKDEARSQITYLPKGNWYDFWTATKYSGQQTIRTAAPLNQIPIFVKGGAVLPMYPIRQNVLEPVQSVTLQAYFDANGESQLYEDAGEGYAYLDTAFKKRKFVTKGDDHSFIIQQITEGNYHPSYATFSVLCIGLPFECQTVYLDDYPVPFERIDSAIKIEVPLNFKLLSFR